MKVVFTKKEKLFLLIFLTSAAFSGLSSSSLAEEELDYLGNYNNKDLQTIIEKPFYLYSENKDSPILFYLKDFIDWQYSLKKDFDYVSEIENPFYCGEQAKNEPFCFISETFEQKVHYKKINKISLKKQETKEYLQNISSDINREPKNGKFEFVKDDKKLKVLEKSKKGIALKVDKSYKKIKNNLVENSETSYIPLEVSLQEPDISTQNPEKYEIKKEMGEGESGFHGSTDTRVHNIKTAASRFHGLVLKPGEVLSFVETLGEVNEKTGYEEELVIKKNKTVPEFGGGICQVSTTMFRAGLNAGLEITERHNHSYPVHYYDPPGTDATVYIPKPDLKIKNTTDNYLLIQTEMEEQDEEFFIYFYSKDDPYEVEIIGPEVTERTPEGRIRTKLEQVVKNKNGEEIRKDVFKSFYDNPDNYPNPDDIFTEKPEDWSNKEWGEYYEKFGPMIEQLKKED
ncbi:MAG: VanW family protein [Candidatus Moraniibacteriota bacterium]